jgi:hypothetical protein
MQNRKWRLGIVALLVLLIGSAGMARGGGEPMDGLSLNLEQKWQETEHRKGWVVLATLSNSGEPRIVPARTCTRVPWASALTIIARTPEGLRETPVSFVDLRYVHAHGPFLIGSGQSLVHEIWLEDYLLDLGVEGRGPNVELSVKLKAQGSADTIMGNQVVEGNPTLTGAIAKLWNGEVNSNWIKYANR